MTNLITVVIPVYNTKQYLQDAIDSIILQKQFIKEIVIVDDGSNDGSSELIDNLYGKIDFIKILHTKNHGQGHARNLGTEIATGDYIYYFDSDDISAPDLFQKFYNILLEKPKLELFCFSGESFLDSSYSIENINKMSVLSKGAYKRRINANCNSGEDAFHLLVKNKAFFPGPPLYILKKSVLITHNIKFNSIRYEDEEFTHKLFMYVGHTYISNKVLFKRRVREGSTMQKSNNFTDISGYFNTIETLSDLKKLEFLKPKTKEILEQRISTFVRIIIELAASKKYNLTKEQKNNYKLFLKPYIFNNLSLLIYYYRYPLEYKLRDFKKQLFHWTKY